MVVTGAVYPREYEVKESIMGTATVNRLSHEQARAELDSIIARLGDLGEARTRAGAYLLSAEDEALLRRGEELEWLLSGV